MDDRAVGRSVIVERQPAECLSTCLCAKKYEIATYFSSPRPERWLTNIHGR